MPRSGEKQQCFSDIHIHAIAYWPCWRTDSDSVDLGDSIFRLSNKLLGDADAVIGRLLFEQQDANIAKS